MNIAAIFAHPDDETMLCGGTLALLAREGAKVHYLCATGGEGGDMGEPPLCTRSDLGKLRSQELECAVNALGGSSLTFLGYIDPLVSPDDKLFAFEVDFDVLVNQIKDWLVNISAGYVITHGSNGEYGHPAHKLLHRAVLQAANTFTMDRPQLFTVQANFNQHPKPRLANKDDSADLVLDVSELKEQKTKAALCHRTQHALFVRRTSEDLGRPVEVHEVIMTLESLYRVRSKEHNDFTDPLTQLLIDTGLVI